MRKGVKTLENEGRVNRGRLEKVRKVRRDNERTIISGIERK